MNKTNLKNNILAYTLITSVVIGEAIAVIYPFLPNKIIYDTKITKVEEDYIKGEEEFTPFLKISIDKYSSCLETNWGYFKRDLKVLKAGSQLEEIVVYRNLIGCDNIIDYRIKEEKQKSKWEPEIEYLIKVEK